MWDLLPEVRYSPNVFLCVKYFHHVLSFECVSHFSIVFSYSDSSNNRDASDGRIPLSYECFRVSHKAFSEPHVLSCAIPAFTDLELISECMKFTYDRRILEFRYEVMFSGKMLTRDTESKKCENRPILGINILKKIFSSS